MNSKNRLLFLSLIFFTGAIILSLEVISSRILTPFFGVSLYIWTSILSITLIFLAIGYQFGGWICTKFKREFQHSIFLMMPVLSAFFILVSSLIYPILLPRVSGIDLLTGSFIGSFVLLAFPLVLLSSLNPILIALIRTTSNKNDSGAGFVFFISTFGSVIGVIFTALIIVPNLTNFSALLINGIFLLGYTLLIYLLTEKNYLRFLKKTFWFLSITTFFLLIILLFYKNDYLKQVTSNVNYLDNKYQIIAEYPSYYGNLKIVGVQPKGQKELSHYILYQNGFTQNIVDKFGRSLSPYTYTLEKLSELSDNKGKALVLGFGAGIVPSKLSQNGFHVDVVDINSKTLLIAEKYFNYKKNNTQIFFEDARIFVKNCKKKYDLVIIDLFFADGVPEHLTTKEFFEDIQKCMNRDGILISNNFTDIGNKLTITSLLSTFYSVYGNIYYFYNKNLVKDKKIKTTNLFIVAFDKPLTQNITFDFEDVPENILKIVFGNLRNSNKFKSNNYNKDMVISDGGNNYSYLFAKSYISFRNLVVKFTPSRILIN